MSPDLTQNLLSDCAFYLRERIAQDESHLLKVFCSIFDEGAIVDL